MCHKRMRREEGGEGERERDRGMNVVREGGREGECGPMFCDHHLLYCLQLFPLPRVYIDPGGLANFITTLTCTGGAARVIDVAIFGESHIYQHPTCKDLYHCLPHDPEGLLGSLNSIVICFLGEESVHYCFQVWVVQ